MYFTGKSANHERQTKSRKGMFRLGRKPGFLSGGATKKFEEHFNEAVGIARASGILLNQLQNFMKESESECHKIHPLHIFP